MLEAFKQMRIRPAIVYIKSCSSFPDIELASPYKLYRIVIFTHAHFKRNFTREGIITFNNNVVISLKN